MVLAALWCPTEQAHDIAAQLRDIKKKHHLPASFEVKWSKVSPAKVGFYIDVLDYFFDNSALHFRALIAEKADLRHQEYAQDHDTWYYKMYFLALQNIFNPSSQYRIYVDIKDSRSHDKVAKLHEVLCNSMYDFRHEILERIQCVHSREVEQIQLADLLAGTMSYANRQLQTSSAKQSLVAHVRDRSGYNLLKTTLLKEEKVNIFHWHPKRKGL
jgi:hypothetical protein